MTERERENFTFWSFSHTQKDADLNNGNDLEFLTASHNGEHIEPVEPLHQALLLQEQLTAQCSFFVPVATADERKIGLSGLDWI